MFMEVDVCLKGEAREATLLGFYEVSVYDKCVVKFVQWLPTYFLLRIIEFLDFFELYNVYEIIYRGVDGALEHSW